MCELSEMKRKENKNINANTKEKPKDHGQLCVCEVSRRGKKIEIKGKHIGGGDRSQKNRVLMWRRNKKSRYIGEEWHVCRGEKTRRKKDKEKRIWR